jgi:hypothetical protein
MEIFIGACSPRNARTSSLDKKSVPLVSSAALRLLPANQGTPLTFYPCFAPPLDFSGDAARCAALERANTHL